MTPRPVLSGSDAVFLLLVKAANRKLVHHFLAADVEFVIVGSSALAFHGLRDLASVGDLDLLVNNTPENAERVGKALASAGVPLAVPSARLTQYRAQVQLKGRTVYWADVLTPSQELPYTEVLANAETATQGQTRLLVACREHLRRMKEEAVGNEQEVGKHEDDLRKLCQK